MTPARLTQTGMTSTQFRSARAALGLTQSKMAEALGVHLRTVQKWEGAERKIPEPVAKLIAMIAGQSRS